MDYQYISTRILNDVDKKLPFPDPKLFYLLCEMFYDKELTNIQFKKGVKMLQLAN